MYYVYVYLDPRKPEIKSYPDIGISFLYEPIYIGKGKGKRCFYHLNKTKKKITIDNQWLQNKINKILSDNLEPFIFKIAYFENEKDAFEFEKLAIITIGRLDLNTGSLVNLTDGGREPKNLSKATYERLSLAHLGKTLSSDHKEKIRQSNIGVRRSSKTRAAISAGLKGRIFSPEWKEKISVALSGKPLSKSHKESLSKSRVQELNHQWKNIDIEKLFALKDAGKTHAEIAEFLSISISTVKRKLKLRD